MSLYVDQFPENDMSRDLAKKHGFTIYDTIAEALTLGGKTLAVDGVLSHRRARQVPDQRQGPDPLPAAALLRGDRARSSRSTRKSVPVFNDKHLAATWDDAKWMYDRARELFVPFLAGSSLPVTWRRPTSKLPKGCELTEAVQIGYGPFEGYGFHALEGLQCMVERRKGGETGVKAVQCLQGEAMWKALDDRPLVEDAARGGAEAACRRTPRATIRELTAKDEGRGRLPDRVPRRLQGGGGDAERLDPRGRRRRVHLRRPAQGRGQARRDASSTCSSPTRSPTSPTW